MSKFVRAWYENTKENQEALFKLGYSWRLGKTPQYLGTKYVFTHEDGGLTQSIYSTYDFPKGTQINLLTAERIQEALDVLKEMYEVDNRVNIVGAGSGEPKIITKLTGGRGKVSPQEWMDKYLPTKSKEQVELEKVINELQDNLEKAKAKLKEL